MPKKYLFVFRYLFLQRRRFTFNPLFSNRVWKKLAVERKLGHPTAIYNNNRALEQSNYQTKASGHDNKVTFFLVTECSFCPCSVVRIKFFFFRRRSVSVVVEHSLTRSLYFDYHFRDVARHRRSRASPKKERVGPASLRAIDSRVEMKRASYRPS